MRFNLLIVSVCLLNSFTEPRGGGGGKGGHEEGTVEGVGKGDDNIDQGGSGEATYDDHSSSGNPAGSLMPWDNKPSAPYYPGQAQRNNNNNEGRLHGQAENDSEQENGNRKVYV